MPRRCWSRLHPLLKGGMVLAVTQTTRLVAPMSAISWSCNSAQNETEYLATTRQNTAPNFQMFPVHENSEHCYHFGEHLRKSWIYGMLWLSKAGNELTTQLKNEENTINIEKIRACGTQTNEKAWNQKCWEKYLKKRNKIPRKKMKERNKMKSANTCRNTFLLVQSFSLHVFITASPSKSSELSLVLSWPRHSPPRQAESWVPWENDVQCWGRPGLRLCLRTSAPKGENHVFFEHLLDGLWINNSGISHLSLDC